MEKIFIDARQDKKEAEVKGLWWAQKRNNVHEHVFSEVKRLKAYYKPQHTVMSQFRDLYEKGDCSIYFQVVKKQNTRQFLQNRLIFNVLKSCVDTAASKIAKNKPRPVYLADRGAWEFGSRARNMTRFMEGMFGQISEGASGDQKTLYGIGRTIFVDAMVQKLGVVKFYQDGDKVQAERVFPETILVDPLEALWGRIRNPHHTAIMPREVALQVYGDTPTKREKIKTVEGTKLKGEGAYADGVDFIEVVESYHLRADEEDVGRKTICIANDTLVDVDYKRDRIPFLFYRWVPALRGFAGLSLSEDLFGIQLEMNKILYDIQRAQHLVAKPSVWLEYKSNVLHQHINNEIGGIRYYHGQPPTFANPQAMGQEVYNHFENLYRKAYELTGISLLAATSQKPAGLNSGVALREYQSIQTERFALAEQRYEDLFMDACQIIEDICDDIAESGGNPVATVKHGKYLERMTWKEVKLPADRRIVRPHPANILPSEPAGKLEKVQEMLQSGFFSKEQAFDLLDYPDLDKARRLATSSTNIIMQLIEKMVDDNVYIPPEPYMDLMKARTMAQNYYLDYKLQNCPEDRLNHIQQFMVDVQAMLDATQPPPVDPAAAPMQTAVPAQPPVSDLLPIQA